MKPWKTMGRMHDKYLIADGKRYILGGRNTYKMCIRDSQKGGVGKTTTTVNVGIGLAR